MLDVAGPANRDVAVSSLQVTTNHEVFVCLSAGSPLPSPALTWARGSSAVKGNGARGGITPLSLLSVPVH